MDLTAIAKRVKRGVKLLDKKVPNWRQVLRKHEDEFDFANGSCCVLGTLEHYSGRMKVLAKQHPIDNQHYFAIPYNRAVLALQIQANNDDEKYGFDAENGEEDRDNEMDTLEALWRAEFEQ